MIEGEIIYEEQEEKLIGYETKTAGEYKILNSL